MECKHCGVEIEGEVCGGDQCEYREARENPTSEPTDFPFEERVGIISLILAYDHDIFTHGADINPSDTTVMFQSPYEDNEETFILKDRGVSNTITLKLSGDEKFITISLLESDTDIALKIRDYIGLWDYREYEIGSVFD